MVFYQAVLIPWQRHDVIYACSSGIAMSGSDEMDSIFECVVPGACGFLLLRPIVAGA
jgi:hypothetical protein